MDSCHSLPGFPQNNSFWHFKALWPCRSGHLLRNRGFIYFQGLSLLWPVIPAPKATGRENPQRNFKGSHKAHQNSDVPDEGIRAMTESDCWHSSEPFSHTKSGETNLSLHPRLYLGCSSVFSDTELATIQKRVQQLGAEMYGIYTTKCEKGTACNIGEQINHFDGKCDRRLDLDCILCES